MHTYPIWKNLKYKHSPAIVLVRDGANYHTWAEDAKIVANALEIELYTDVYDFETWERTDTTKFSAARIEQHLKTLSKIGHRIAVCDEVLANGKIIHPAQNNAPQPPTNQLSLI
jgi:DNA mismatch repair ATPase MutS